MKMSYLRSILIGLGSASLIFVLAIAVAWLVQLAGYQQSGGFLLLSLIAIELFFYFIYRQSSRKKALLKHVTDTTVVAGVLFGLFLIWHGLVMHDSYPLIRYFEPLAVVVGAALGAYVGNYIYLRKRVAGRLDGE